VYLNHGEAIEVYCTSGFASPSTEQKSLLATCADDNQFQVDGVAYSFIDLRCITIPYHTARATGYTCFNGASLVEIGFDAGDRFFKVLEVCHDTTTEETYYAKYRLTPAIAG